MPFGATGIYVGLMLVHQEREQSYARFSGNQRRYNKYAPSKDQYFLAMAMDYDIRNPPPPPYFKIKLALLINAIADLLPGSE